MVGGACYHLRDMSENSFLRRGSQREEVTIQSNTLLLLVILSIHWDFIFSTLHTLQYLELVFRDEETELRTLAYHPLCSFSQREDLNSSVRM